MMDRPHIIEEHEVHASFLDDTEASARYVEYAPDDDHTGGKFLEVFFSVDDPDPVINVEVENVTDAKRQLSRRIYGWITQLDILPAL